MKLPLKPDGQWPQTVVKKKVVLVQTYEYMNTWEKKGTDIHTMCTHAHLSY